MDDSFFFTFLLYFFVFYFLFFTFFFLSKTQQDRKREKHLLQVKNGEEEVISSLVETSASVGKVHAFCEICILVMQMKERGQPHLCAGLNPDYFVSVRV